MGSPDFFEPHDFDPSRIDWDSDEFWDSDSNELSIDLRHPTYVIRRRFMFSVPVFNEATASWASRESERPLGVEDTEFVCELAHSELGRLAATGIPIPRRSRYIVKAEEPADSSPAQVYLYVKRIRGEQLDPANKDHAPFILPNCRSRLTYLAETAMGGLFLSDPCLTQNYTVGKNPGGAAILSLKRICMIPIHI